MSPANLPEICSDKIYHIFIIALIFSLCQDCTSAQQKSAFKPSARIVFADSSVIELSNFEFHSYHSRPSYYYQTSSSKEMLLPVKQGNLWREISINDIDKIVLTKIKERYNWLQAEIYLRAGDELKCEIPGVPSLMWKSGRAININGNISVLGRTGKLKLSIDKIKKLERAGNSASKFILTTQEGETKTITKPYLTCYWYGSDPKFTTWKINSYSRIKFNTGDLSVFIKLRDIDSLAFMDKGDKVFIKLKDGNTASGKFNSGISKIKGKTSAGLILYQEISGYPSDARIKSIKFLTPR